MEQPSESYKSQLTEEESNVTVGKKVWCESTSLPPEIIPDGCSDSNTEGGSALSCSVMSLLN